MTVLERYCSLDLGGALIGLEKGDREGGYYCTPQGMTVIAWENCIHYGTIEGFGEMIFAVNPENFGNTVYPLAENFQDFLCLILAAGSATAIEQIVLWDREQFQHFLQETVENPEREAILREIQERLQLKPMEDPFAYVKQLQENFKGEIPFGNEYYDTAGLPRPDGTSPEEEECGFEVMGLQIKL